jgi:hypothetical protein
MPLCQNISATATGEADVISFKKVTTSNKNVFPGVIIEQMITKRNTKKPE